MLKLILSSLFLTTGLYAQNRVVTGDIFPNVNVEKNYIVNGTFDQNVNGVAGYDDGASRPVDGTGGTVTTTCTRNTTTPIEGNGSLIITKSASNLQGEGCAIAFTLPSKEYAKVMQVEFEYKVQSGTFAAGSDSADSDVIVYLYDVTNSKLIEPSTFKLYTSSTSLTEKFVGNFQTSATGTSYRLLFHVATTSASAYTLEIDKVSVSRSKYVYGTPITDWSSYTPTLTNITLGNGTSTAFYRRVGDSIEINFSFKMGSTSAMGSVPQFSLPNGLSVDGSKYSAPNGEFTVGYGKVYDSGTDSFEAIVDLVGSNNFSIRIAKRQGADYIDFPNISSTVPMTWTTNDAITVRTESIPIAGWSSSVKMSDGYDGRIIAFDIYRAAAQSIPNASETKVGFDTVGFDDAGGWDSANSRYVIRTSGKYAVKALVTYLANGSNSREIRIKINGTTRVRIQKLTNGSGYDTGVLGARNFNLNAGDYIEVFAYQDSGGALGLEAGSEWTYLSVEKINGPTSIAASAKVVAIYRISGDKTPSVNSPVDYDTKIEDTHNAVTTGASWKFTAPEFGFYTIRVVAAKSASGGTIDLYKNGVIDRGIMSFTGTDVRGSSVTVKLNAQDYISVNADSSSMTFTGTKNNTIFIVKE